MRSQRAAASVIGVALAAGLTAACGFDPPGEAKRELGAALPVHVETVVSEAIAPGLVVTGVVEAGAARTLGFSVAGRIERTLVTDGARVERGDALVELERGELLAGVASARAASDRAHERLAGAERRNARRRRLFELAAASPVPPEADDIAVALHAAEVRQARAVLDDAEERLAAAVLRAPSVGLVDRRYRSEGAEVAAGEPVLRLIELDRVVVRGAVPRALASLAPEGGSAVARVVGDPAAAAHPGSLRRLAGGSDSPRRQVAFEFWVENPDHALRPQMLVEVVVAADLREAHFTVPLASVRAGFGDEPFAFVVVGEGDGARVERRALRLAGLRRDRVAVVAGLGAGDRVVSRGAELLTVGDAVRVVGEGP